METPTPKFRTDINYHTVSEAAVIFRTTEYTIRKWCREGKLRCTKIGRSWLIELDVTIQVTE